MVDTRQTWIWILANIEILRRNTKARQEECQSLEIRKPLFVLFFFFYKYWTFYIFSLIFYREVFLCSQCESDYFVNQVGPWLGPQKVFDLVSRRWKRLFGEWMDYCLHPIYPRSNSSNFSLQSDSSSSSSLYCLYLQMIVLWSNDRLMDQARPGLLVSAEDIESFIR